MPHGVTLQRAETSLGAIELFTFDRYRHAFPRHAHDILTLGVFGTGNGTIRVRGGTHRAAPGMLLALAPNEVHSAEPLRPGWTYRSLCPSPTLLSHALDGAAGGFSFGQPVIADAGLAREVAAVHGALARGPVTLDTEVRVVELLRRAVRRHASEPSHESVRPSARLSDIAARASELMEARLAGPLHLAEVARECGVSPFQLIRAFHAAFGVPPHAYLMQARLRRARAMLRGEGLISTVAFACGFVDQSHLTRMFKRYYGMTPGLYSRTLAHRG